MLLVLTNQTDAKLSAKKKRKTVILADSEAVDVDGIPIEVDVQFIVDSGSTHEGKTADIDVFFGPSFDHMGTNGKIKHCRCKTCL